MVSVFEKSLKQLLDWTSMIWGVFRSEIFVRRIYLQCSKERNFFE